MHCKYKKMMEGEYEEKETKGENIPQKILNKILYLK